MNMMHIAMLVHNITWKGGAFYRAFGFARNLAALGHDVSVLAISPKRRTGVLETCHEGVRIVETPDLTVGMLRSGWDPWDALWRTVYLRKTSCDIVHCVDTRPAVILPALWSRRSMGARLVTDWTDWFSRGGVSLERPGVPVIAKGIMAPIETYFEESFHRSASGVIAISRMLYDRALSLGVPSEKAVLIRPGCDTRSLHCVDVRECRRELGLDPHSPIVGFMGALAPRDGDLLLSSMRLVSKSVPGASLLLIGNHRFALTPEHRESVRIMETAFVPMEKVASYLGACDVLALPMADSLANRARWPSKINDYLAVGRPVVMTTVGDAAPLLVESHAGLAVRPDPKEFAQGVLSVIENRYLGGALGNAARRLAENELSWTRSVDALDDFYHKVLQSS